MPDEKASATLAHMRKVGRNLSELEDRDRMEAALRDPGEKIAAGLTLGAELAAHHRFPDDEEPEGVLLLRRWRALHGPRSSPA